ncbi:MAG: UPF0280 family protein [Candidatus Omnitrophica bacterium]|nr:UPF0280 family protein [Candidatus Omnitrophota bacterium]
MKHFGYQRRFYRDWINPRDLYINHIVDKETDLQVLTNKRLDIDFFKERLHQYRWEIENYIIKDKRFLTALKPIPVDPQAPLIIQKMAEATKLAEVGPMAGVAGAVAEFLGKDLLKKGYKEVIIENGGDIFLKTSKRRIIQIYTGNKKIWRGLGLKIKPQDTPLGVCTSSGTIGHSLSFGRADTATIISKNTALADAVATAVANRVSSAQDLPKALEFARSIKGVLGVIIIIGNNLISWGKVEFVRLR